MALRPNSATGTSTGDGRADPDSGHQLLASSRSISPSRSIATGTTFLWTRTWILPVHVVEGHLDVGRGGIALAGSAQKPGLQRLDEQLPVDALLPGDLPQSLQDFVSRHVCP